MNPVHIQITHKTSRSQTNICIRSAPGADFGVEFLKDLNDRYPGKVPIRTISLITSKQPPGIQLASRNPLMVNGVEVRHKNLQPGDVLFLGPLRICFKIGEEDLSDSLVTPPVAVEPPKPAAKPSKPAAKPPKPAAEETVVPAEKKIPPAEPKIKKVREKILKPERKPRVLPKITWGLGKAFRVKIAAALLFLLLLAFGLVFVRPGFRDARELPEEMTAPEIAEVPKIAEVPEVQEVPEAPEIQEVPEVQEVPEAPVVPKPPVVPEVLKVPEESAPALRYGAGPLVAAPGSSLPDIPVQVLFIHAHPDDESLDYGAFLAWCETRGLNTAVVLLTDGESGLDLYPFRQTWDGYPDKPLSGAELADVRIREATLAMKILGVDAYIRMGQPNHPYNGRSDEISPEKLMEKWGGQAGLISGLGKIIEHFKPDLIVSPDGPSGAREHFEHETTGVLVSRTLAELARKGVSVPPAHLTSIDPRQQSVYPDRIELDGKLLFSAAAEGGTLRDAQMQALEMHKTQNDAFVIGRQFLSDYPREFYQIQYWNRKETWEEFLNLTGF